MAPKTRAGGSVKLTIRAPAEVLKAGGPASRYCAKVCGSYGVLLDIFCYPGRPSSHGSLLLFLYTTPSVVLLELTAFILGGGRPGVYVEHLMSALRVLEKARSKLRIPGDMATAFIGLVVELARAYRERGGAAAGIAAEVATAVLSAVYEVKRASRIQRLDQLREYIRKHGIKEFVDAINDVEALVEGRNNCLRR